MEMPSMTTSKPTPSRGPGGKPITRALIAALEESAPGADAPNLRRIVDNLIGKAIDGDLAAIREIFDRIDGKAPAAAAGSDAQEPRKVMFEWKSNE
jgi:ribosomal protein L17